MSTGWIVAFVVLSAVTCLLLVGFLGLARYAAAIAARLPDQLPLELSQGPDVGTTADGVAGALEAFLGEAIAPDGLSLVLFLSTSCDACRGAADGFRKYARLSDQAAIRLTAVVSGANASPDCEIARTLSGLPIVFDAAHTVGSAFGIQKVPFALAYMDAKLAAKGVVNSLPMLENLALGRVRHGGDQFVGGPDERELTESAIP